MIEISAAVAIMAILGSAALLSLDGIAGFRASAERETSKGLLRLEAARTGRSGETR